MAKDDDVIMSFKAGSLYELIEGEDGYEWIGEKGKRLDDLNETTRGAAADYGPSKGSLFFQLLEIAEVFATVWEESFSVVKPQPVGPTRREEIEQRIVY